MVEIKPESYCKTKNVECAILPLVAQKDKLIDNFLKEAKKSFNQASSNYHEEYETIQGEIDNLSTSCPNCPYSSKSLALSAQAYLERKTSNN